MGDYTRAKLNMYADLAAIGAAYAAGRLTRREYTAAAICLGLSAGQAELRAAAWETHSNFASCT